MGIKDIKELFNPERSIKFRTSVIISYVAFIVMLLLYSHVVFNMRQNNVIDLSSHVITIYIMFAIGIITFMIRNIVMHKAAKGIMYILLKLFVLFFFALLLYVMQLQTLLLYYIVPGLPTSDILLVIGTLVSLTLVKLIVG